MRMSRYMRTETDYESMQFGSLLEQIERRYSSNLFTSNMAAAFVLYLVKKRRMIDLDQEELPLFLHSELNDRLLEGWICRRIGDHWNAFRNLLAPFSIECMKEYIVTRWPASGRESEFATPECICDLAIGLMKRFGGRRFFDPCCGFGRFMLRLFTRMDDDFRFAGADLSEQCVCISKIRNCVLEMRSDIFQRNAFEARNPFVEIDMFEDQHEMWKRDRAVYDNIFVDPPRGQRLVHIQNPGSIPPAFPLLKGSNSTEWIWGVNALESLDSDGHAAIIVSNGALSNMIESPLRRYLIERGLVESVIALPERMLNYASIGLNMVILSRTPHDYVKMIDASEVFEHGARVNVMTSEQIASVVDAFCSPSPKSPSDRIPIQSYSYPVSRKDIPLSEIAEKDYQLSVRRYFMPEIRVHNGRPLAELCRSISRGAPLSREALHEKRMDSDRCAQSDPSRIVRCLTLANVQDGIIDGNLPILDSDPLRYERYIVEKGDIVLTKSVMPCKIAVAEIPDGVSVLATGNFFILRLQYEQIDPYYLMGYLLSEEGRAQIEMGSSGTTIRTIAQENLEKILIPMVPLSDQRKFGERYRRTLGRLAALRREYEECRKELDRAYDAFHDLNANAGRRNMNDEELL